MAFPSLAIFDELFMLRYFDFTAWKVLLFFGLARITGAAFVSQVVPDFL